MSRSVSAGWREVYEWLDVPMTSRYAATSGEANSGTTTQHKTMSEGQNRSGRKVTERYAKRKLREIARDLESAQGTATIPQLVDEIEEAGAELAYVKTQVEDEVSR